MLPKDPLILLSVINTRLRDEYSSLTELCAALDEEEHTLRDTLAAIGYIYNPEQNQFI